MSKYYALQLKRALKLLPYVFAAMGVLLLALFVIFHYVGQATEEENAVRFRLGIVGSTDDSYLMAGLEIVQSYDSARFAVDTVQMDELEAVRALESGKLDAYVVIPEDYILDAMNGKLGSLKYVSTSGAADLTTLFKDEITAVVSDIIIACEQAMFGVEEALASKQLEERTSEYVYDISLTYVDYILQRDELYSLDILGVHDSLGMDGYLFSGISVLVISLLLLPICVVVIKNDHAFEQLLKSKNIGSSGQVLGEFGALFTVYSLTFLILCFIVSVVSTKLPNGILRFSSIFSLEHFYVFFSVLFALSAFSYFILLPVKNMVSGVLLQFAAGLVLCFTSGCLYPLSFFPESIQRIAVVFPQFYCKEAFSSVITSEPSGSCLLILAGYGVAFLLLSILIRSLQLRKGQG